MRKKAVATNHLIWGCHETNSYQPDSRPVAHGLPDHVASRGREVASAGTTCPMGHDDERYAGFPV